MKKLAGVWRRATSRVRKLPDFIIIGAQRSGTSTLYEHIIRHPNVRSAFRKEVHYFDRHYERGLAWYRAWFPVHGFTGEASPSYLFVPEIPERVVAILPRVKLIAILRNPIDRAYSAYNRNVRLRRETRPFSEAIAGGPTLPFKYLERGRYAEQLECWFKYYEREQLLVLSAEKFFADAPSVLGEVFKFLGLPSWDGDETVKNWVAKQYNYSYDDMDAAMRAKLADYFRPHNERLHRLLGEKFGWDA
jgi:hypothetical protein